MNPFYTHQKYLTEELNRLDYSKPVIVLEFGTGDGSASILQSFAHRYPNLRIESFETDLSWLQSTYSKYCTDNYHFNHVDSWESYLKESMFEEVYDLVFVDQSPWEARIQTINTLKDKTKVFIVHDYDYYNKGVMDDLYCVSEGSFFGDKYSKEFILQGNNEYPGTLIMRKKPEHYITNMFKFINETTGIYIEVGANDGITQSYTYELEKSGWHGILIEPSLEAFNKCAENRPGNKLFNCALVASDSINEIAGDFNGSFLSSVGGERLFERDGIKKGIITVKSRTLNSILEEAGVGNIDLFSLDVEGYEMEVLKGFDINKYKPKYVIIEVYGKTKDDIFNFMKVNNYEILSNLTGYNRKDYPAWDGTHNDFLFKRI